MRLFQFFLLVYGKIFLAEYERDKDRFSAKVSSAVQVALLVTLNLVSVLFTIYAFIKDYLSIDISSADRSWFLMTVGLFMVISIALVYRVASSLGNVEASYRGLRDRTILSGSKLPVIAKVYPVVSMAALVISIGVLVVMS